MRSEEDSLNKIFYSTINILMLRKLTTPNQYYTMAFLQIPHSALPEKNSKDPPVSTSIEISGYKHFC